MEEQERNEDKRAQTVYSFLREFIRSIKRFPGGRLNKALSELSPNNFYFLLEQYLTNSFFLTIWKGESLLSTKKDFWLGGVVPP